jgi:hypothetical protein
MWFSWSERISTDKLRSRHRFRVLLRSLVLRHRFCSQLLLTLADDLLSFFLRKGKDFVGALRQLGRNEQVRGSQFLLDLPGAECIPAQQRDPMRLGQVGRWDNVFVSINS